MIEDLKLKFHLNMSFFLKIIFENKKRTKHLVGLHVLQLAP